MRTFNRLFAPLGVRLCTCAEIVDDGFNDDGWRVRRWTGRYCVGVQVGRWSFGVGPWREAAQ